MRASTRQALHLQHHNDLLALQQSQLDNIQQNFSNGNTVMISQSADPSNCGQNSRSIQSSKKHGTRQKKHESFRVQFPIPQWLTSRTWTLATYQSQGSWGLEIRPVFRRPPDTDALDCIRTGDIAALQRFLDTGELSMWDVTQAPFYYKDHVTLLGVCTN